MISWFLPVNLLALLMLLVCQSVQYKLSSNTVIANGCGRPVIDIQYRDIIRSNRTQASRETRESSFHCPFGLATVNPLKSTKQLLSPVHRRLGSKPHPSAVADFIPQ